MKILSIIPAPGWRADLGDEGDAPLVCWALIENEDGSREVSGLYAVEGQVCPADEDQSFSGYKHKSQRDW